MYGDEAATQLASMYDMKIAAYQSQHMIEAAEDEQNNIQLQLDATTKKLEANAQAITKAESQLKMAKKLYDASGEDVDNAVNVPSPIKDSLVYKIGKKMSFGISDFLYNKIEQALTPKEDEIKLGVSLARSTSVSAAKKSLDELNKQREKLIEQQQLDENAIQAQRQKIANLNMSAANTIAKMDWDNINRIQASGGDMYYDWTKEAAEHIDDFTSDAYKNIERTAENTDDLATMLKELLQIKQ